MLKIKDNVDLKKLEKFGFKYRKGNGCLRESYYHTIKDEEDLYPHEDCFVLIENKKIVFGIWQYNIDIVFDLIQAGLVEKVEIPNETTIKAIKEADKMVKNGCGGYDNLNNLLNDFVE